MAHRLFVRVGAIGLIVIMIAAGYFIMMKIADIEV
jgi:hypothetical protein